MPLNISSSLFDRLVNFSPSSHIPDVTRRACLEHLLPAAAGSCQMLRARGGRRRIMQRGGGNLGVLPPILLQLCQLFL